MGIVQLILFAILPVSSYADLLHINDGGGAVDSRPAGEIAPYENINFRDNYSTRPGSPWEFGFAFKESAAKFKWTIDVVVENDPREAGHNHNTPPAELFYFPDWPNKKNVARLSGGTVRSPLLDQNQKFVVHLATVGYATKLTARGTYTQFFYGKTLNPTLTHVLEIRTPGLELLPRNDRLYKSSGGTIIHPDNHYGTAITIAALKELAAAWKSSSPALPLLEIGNVSLPWGGLLDTNADWKTADISHAFGIAADIGKRDLRSDERAALITLMCGKGFYVYNATEDKKEQFHIVHKNELSRLKGLKWPVSLPDTKEGIAIDCCSVKNDTPEYKTCLGFSETLKGRRVSLPMPILRQ